MTGNSNTANNKITVLGELLAFAMPKEGLNQLDFPVAVCKLDNFESPIILRWNEAPELVNLLGKPLAGTRIEAQLEQDNSPILGMANRRFTSKSADFSFNKDDRTGLAYVTAGTFKSGEILKRTYADPSKQMSVPGSNVSIIVNDKEALLKGGATNRIISSSQYGNVITGPLSISTSFSKVRVGGLWQLNPLLQSTIPSTIVTPLPVFIFSPPTGGIRGIAAILKYTKELLI